LNNLLKNIGIWLVIGLVVLTVVKQFDSRQTSKDTVAYSDFMDQAKSGRVGPDDQVGVDGQEALRHLQPR
jgi:cell division protease FtsH